MLKINKKLLYLFLIFFSNNFESQIYISCSCDTGSGIQDKVIINKTLPNDTSFKNFNPSNHIQVKNLQKFLGLKEDGIFGIYTKRCYEMFVREMRIMQGKEPYNQGSYIENIQIENFFKNDDDGTYQINEIIYSLDDYNMYGIYGTYHFNDIRWDKNKIKKLQKFIGVKADGIYGPITKKRLKFYAEVLYNFNLYTNTKEYVAKVQELFNVDVDSLYGPNTDNAIRNFCYMENIFHNHKKNNEVSNHNFKKDNENDKNDKYIELILPKGTEIKIKLKEKLSSQKNYKGEKIEFEIYQDVVCQSKGSSNLFSKKYTVIKKYEDAVGEITHVKEAKSLGRAGELDFDIKHTFSYDDKKIKLSSEKNAYYGSSKTLGTLFIARYITPLGLLRKGEKIEINSGKIMTVYTAENYTFKWENN